jgi:hypothetical protein
MIGDENASPNGGDVLVHGDKLTIKIDENANARAIEWPESIKANLAKGGGILDDESECEKGIDEREVETRRVESFLLNANLDIAQADRALRDLSARTRTCVRVLANLLAMLRKGPIVDNDVRANAIDDIERALRGEP